MSQKTIYYSTIYSISGFLICLSTLVVSGPIRLINALAGTLNAFHDFYIKGVVSLSKESFFGTTLFGCSNFIFGIWCDFLNGKTGKRFLMLIVSFGCLSHLFLITGILLIQISPVFTLPFFLISICTPVGVIPFEIFQDRYTASGQSHLIQKKFNYCTHSKSIKLKTNFPQ